MFARSELSKSVSVVDFYSGESTYDAAFEKAIATAARRTSVIIPKKVATVASSVLVPPGDYRIAKSIVVREGVRLSGASKGASIIRYEGPGAAALILGAPPLLPEGAPLEQGEFSNVSIENLSVIGNGAAGSVGVKFAGCIRGSSITDCQISNFGVNVQGEGSYGFRIERNFIHDAKVNNIHWSSPTASSIRLNRIDDAGEDGVLIDDLAKTEVIGLTVSENVIQSSHRSGLRIEDAVQVSVDNNFFEANCLGEQDCAHLLFAPGSMDRPKKSLVINLLGNFFTPGPRSKHFPNKSFARPIEVRNARQLNLIGVVARGFAPVRLDSTPSIGVQLGVPGSGNQKVDKVFSRGCVFNGMASPYFLGNQGSVLDTN